MAVHLPGLSWGGLPVCLSSRCRLLLLLLAPAHSPGRATWSLEAKPATVAPGGGTLISATARIDPGWHLYSASSPSGLPAAFQVEPGTLARVFQPPPKKGVR